MSSKHTSKSVTITQIFHVFSSYMSKLGCPKSRILEVWADCATVAARGLNFISDTLVYTKLSLTNLQFLVASSSQRVCVFRSKNLKREIKETCIFSSLSRSPYICTPFTGDLKNRKSQFLRPHCTPYFCAHTMLELTLRESHNRVPNLRRKLLYIRIFCASSRK